MAKSRFLRTIFSSCFILSFVFTQSLESPANLDNFQGSMDFILQDILEKYADSDPNEFWQPFTSIKNENREVVQIEKVEKRNIPGNCLAWREAQLGTKNFLVGISNHSIDLYESDLTKITGIGTSESIVALSVYTKWSDELSQPVIFVPVATNEPKPSIHVYKVINGVITKSAEVWPIQHQIKDLKFGNTGLTTKLILIPAQPNAPIDIYNIAATSADTQVWFHQRIPVDGDASVHVFEMGHGPVSTIAIASGKVVKIYSFDLSVGQYIISQSIPLIEPAKELVSYTLDYQSFLVSVPEPPNKVEFFSVTANEFIRETKFGQLQAAHVYTIRVEDYNHEPLLLTQQKDGEIQFLLFNRKQKSFEIAFKCAAIGLCSSHADLSKGASFISNGTALYVLPSEQLTKSVDVFLISKQIHQISSPEHQFSRSLYAEYDALKRRFAQWELMTSRILDTLEHSLSRKDPNEIEGTWKVGKLSGHEVIIREEVRIDSERGINTENSLGDFVFAHVPWIDHDFQVSLSAIDNKISELGKATTEATFTLLDSIPLTSDDIQIVRAKQRILSSLRAISLVSSEVQVQGINRQLDVTAFFKNIVRKHQDLSLKNSLTVRGDLTIENLDTKTINDIQVLDIARLIEKNTFICPIQFNVPFKVHANVITPEVEGIKLSDEIIKPLDVQRVTFADGIVALKEATVSTKINSILVQRDTFDNLLLESTNQIVSAKYSFEDLHTINDVQVETMNGEDINLVLDSIVHDEFRGVIRGEKTILGKVTAEKIWIVETLNSILFPAGFARSKSIISSHKRFSHFTANAVSLDGKINKLSTNDLVSATEPSILSTIWTFQDSVQFMDDLKVKNNVDGVKMESLKHWDTLDEHKSNYKPNADIRFEQPVHFSSLYVDSTINRRSFAETFGKFLSLNSKTTNINGLTVFKKNVAFDSLRVDSRKVNNLNLSDFFTTNTQQHIVGAKFLTKPVIFSSLYALNKFNSVILSKLYEFAFRVSDTRTISTKLIFEHLSCESTMKVDGSINNFQNFASDVAVKNGREHQNFESSLEFDEFQAKHFEITDHLKIANGKTLAEVDLLWWYSNKIPLTKPVRLFVSFTIAGTATVHGNVLTDKINGISLSYLTSGVLRSDRTHQEFKGKVVFTGLIEVVKGRVIFGKNLSGHDFNEILNNAFHITSTAAQVIRNNWRFTSIIVDDFTINGKTCGVDLARLDMDSVRKGESDLHISGSKDFKGEFLVEHALLVTRINGTDYFRNIFTLHTDQDVKNEYVFQKNVNIDSLTGSESINGIHIVDMAKLYSFNGTTHVLNYDVEAEDSLSSSALIVSGLVQNQNFQQFLANKVARANPALRITGRKILTQTGLVRGNIVTQMLNDIKVENLFAKLARITESLRFAHLVTFQNAVETPELYIDHGGLIAPNTIGGVNLHDLVSNAIRINTKLITTALHFESCTVVKDIDEVLTLNGIPIKDIITINERQDVGSLHVEDATLNGENVQVGNQINGHNIQNDFHDTLWRNSGQEQFVTGLKRLEGHVTIEGNFECLGKERHQIIELNENNLINSKVEFNQQIHVNRNLDVTGLVNGHSIKEMERNTLTNGRNEEITGFWTFNEGMTFKKDVGGQGLVNGLDISNLVPEKLTEAKEAKDTIKDELDLFEKACRRLDSYKLKSSQSPVRLHFVDSHQTIALAKPILKMISLKAGQHLHILTFSESCDITNYEWSTKDELFQEEDHPELRLGFVKAWTSTSYKGTSLLVTLVNDQHASGCSSLSSGLYTTVLNANGKYSSTLPLKTGNFINMQLVKYGQHVLLLALMEDHTTLAVFVQNEEKETFISEKDIKLVGPVIQFQAISYKEGVAIFYHCQNSAHMSYFSFEKEEFKQLGETKFSANSGTSSKIVVFSSQDSLYGVLETSHHSESIIQPDCALQTFQFYDGAFKKFQRLKTHHTVAISEITVDQYTYIAILSKYIGVQIYKFSGLGGFEPMNKNPIPLAGGTEMISFEVDAWNTIMSTPFLAVSTPGHIKIFHSILLGDRAQYNGESQCKIQ